MRKEEPGTRQRHPWLIWLEPVLVLLLASLQAALLLSVWCGGKKKRLMLPILSSLFITGGVVLLFWVALGLLAAMHRLKT